MIIKGGPKWWTAAVYGANSDIPVRETEKADNQLTIYAATKKANESVTHSYGHLSNLPTTMFRFCTVNGTWGFLTLRITGLSMASSMIGRLISTTMATCTVTLPMSTIWHAAFGC